MKIKKLHMIVLACVFVSTVFLLLFLCINPLAKRDQLHSDLMFLDNVMRTYIKEYYEQNMRYPKDIQEIETAILKRCYIDAVPDDSRFKDLLNNINFSSDGNKCTLSWQIEKGYVVYRYETIFENGQTVNNNTQKQMSTK